MGHGRANKVCGICLMDQHVTANRQIEGRRIDKVLCGAFTKLNVRVACAARAAARGAEGVAITINTDATGAKRIPTTPTTPNRPAVSAPR